MSGGLQRREALLLFGAGAAMFGERAAAQALKDQPPLPATLSGFRELAVRDAAGATTTLGRLIGGERPTVLSFWASWCAPCLVEARHLASLRTQYPENRLAIIGVNVDAAKDAAKVEPFRIKAKMNYTQAVGQEPYFAVTGTRSIALPRTYVFDAAGRPVAAFGRFYGRRTTKAITAAVQKALAG